MRLGDGRRVALKERALENLPTSMFLVRGILQDSVRACSDMDGDGELDAPRECVIEHTFWQLLAAHSYLETKPAECEPIKQPRAWAVSGFYPTERCVRWVEEKGEFRLSVEGLVYRESS